MQILLDAIAHQRATADYNPSRTIVRKFKNEGEALQEAAELIQNIIAECLERNLPIDEALVALHVATLKKIKLTDKDYSKIIEENRSEPISKIRQSRSVKNASLLRKIDESSRLDKAEIVSLRREVNELRRQLQEKK